jgi:hypothetical protein
MLTIDKPLVDPAAAMTKTEPEFPDLQSAIDAEELNTHALLLLYLMPVANRSDVDPNTAQAVEVLSDVQSRLSMPSCEEPFSRDSLAMVYSRLSAIRFGKQ